MKKKKKKWENPFGCAICLYALVAISFEQRQRVSCKHMLSLTHNENWIDIARYNILTDEMMPPTNEVNHYFIWIINSI